MSAEKSAKKRIAFIINPISGTNNKSNIREKIKNYFSETEIDIDIIVTKRPGDATRFAGQFVREFFDAVIAVGGDGTVNEIANGIRGGNIAMGIIPSGSGNGFARHAHIPLKTEEALKVISDFFTIDVDTMNINNKVSVNVSGVGFDAMVADKFQKLSKRGLSSYAKIIIAELPKYKAQNYSISIDGEQIEIEAFLISLANSSQFGNNAYISPEASVTDGLIDLCIVKKFKKIESPIFAQKLMFGNIHKSKYVEIIRAKEIIIKQQSDVYHLDGDAMYNGKNLKISISQGALKMIIPQNSKNKI